MPLLSHRVVELVKHGSFNPNIGKSDYFYKLEIMASPNQTGEIPCQMFERF